MADERNLAWLRGRVERLVNANLQQPNQSFAGPTTGSDDYLLVDDAINDAYQEEITELQMEVGLQPFLLRYSMTWPASQTTLVLPDALLDRQIYDLYDETNSDPGELLWVSQRSQGASIHVRDRTTLQWGDSGPSSARTVVARYVAEANDMRDPLDVPYLVPFKFRPLLVWGAAVTLSMMADQDRIPQVWLMTRQRLRTQFIMMMSRGPLVMHPMGFTIIDERATAER